MEETVCKTKDLGRHIIRCRGPIGPIPDNKPATGGGTLDE
jgi:hypothetical protein